MSKTPTQKLNPKIKYNVINFKIIADFGAASTHGGHSCIHCKNCQGYSECNHPCLQKPFKLGTHADRMGCRNGWEAHAETWRRGKSGGSGKSGNEANARRGQESEVRG